MRVLITAGATTQAVDAVRYITNQATGKLGATIAEYFATKGHHVEMVTTSQAVAPPKSDFINIFHIKTIEDLLAILTDKLKVKMFDAVIHSMAVSDYRPVATFSQEKFIDELAQGSQKMNSLNESFERIMRRMQNYHEKGKISSESKRLVTILERNPKVIQKIKKIQPRTILVGFKLLVNASKSELLEAAKKSMEKACADFLVANDFSSIEEDKHHAYLLTNKNDVYQEAFTKKEIAQLLFAKISEIVNSRRN